MHELAVTQSILEIALRHAQTQNAKRITHLYIQMGEWSSIVDDSIQFYWDMISENTIATAATLHFNRIPVSLTCKNCEFTYAPDSKELSCPRCSSSNVKVVSGEEFFLDSIEIET
jgi:hydrogenase nickel incorporation protein HypA/HybF